MLRKIVSRSLLIAFLLASPAVCLADNSQAVVSNIKGDPTIIRNGQEMPASVGMACEKGDVLKTTSQCQLDLSLNQVAGCRVLGSSECQIADAKASDMYLKVTDGNVILNLKKLPESCSFRVETPTAVAAVRGTQFWGRVDLQKIDNPVTTFAVREGSVEILAKSAAKSFTITPGQALDIPKDPQVTPSIRPALPAEMQAMEQAHDIQISE